MKNKILVVNYFKNGAISYIYYNNRKEAEKNIALDKEECRKIDMFIKCDYNSNKNKKESE